jgi:MinD-like ATPase involved in chromosome partitioning or flagellar assembly
MFPIVYVSSFSGNVGKTTITKNLLVPNMKDVVVVAVEDVNAGYNQGEAVQLTAAETAGILELVLATAMERPVVVDVGASNVSNFFAALSGYDGIHEFIDRVIVPAEPSDKVQTDTLSTLHYLIEKLGFDPSKVMLLLNKVPTKRKADAVFGNLMNEAAGMGVLTYGEIPESETFALAASMKKSIYDLAAMDPKQLLAESQVVAASGSDPKAGVRNMLAAASAKKLKVRFDEIFEALGIPDGEE